MTEDESKDWIVTRFGTSAVDTLSRFVALVRSESQRQNLISASTMDTIWTRHVADSAQLVPLAPSGGRWIDIGTGAGFPGIVVASLLECETILVEPRRRRVEFLEQAIDVLNIGRRVSVTHSTIEKVAAKAAVISARAVASIETLLAGAVACTTAETRWLLPKGRTAVEEVAQTKKAWHGTFHVEHSITDPESMIVIASKVSRR